MKRTLSLLLGTALLALAAILPPPPTPSVPEAPAVDRPTGLTEYTFCPQWRSDGAIESQLRGLPAEDQGVRVEWWNGDSFSVALEANRVGAISSSLRQGVVPVMLEAGGPVAVAVRAQGPVGRASSGCASWPAPAWAVGIGGSLEGESTVLVLMNPFPQAATVDIGVYSEQGLEVVEDLEGFTVPAGASREVDLSEALRLRTALMVVVDDPAQSTFAALLTYREGVTGSAIAKPLSEQWYFPAPPTGTDGEVMVVNPSGVPVTVDIDYFGPDGSTLSAEQLTLERRSSALVAAPVGVAIQVRADSQVGAAMRAASASTLGIMTGIPSPSMSWVLPGVSIDEELVGLNIINPGPSKATATYRFVGARGSSQPVSFEVGAGASAYLEVRASGSQGIVVEADEPIVVAWSTVGEEQDLVLDGGVAR